MTFLLQKFRSIFPYTLLSLLLAGLGLFFFKLSTQSFPSRYTHSWVPELGINLDFQFNHVSLFFIGLILFIGLAVFHYANWYMKSRRTSFFAFLGAFTLAMLGAVSADNMLLLFVFWELTSVFSFLLIGFNHDTKEGQFGARISLLVTGFGALAMLVGFLILAKLTGTLLISEMVANGGNALLENTMLTQIAIGCILGGIASKSAQFPLHFWLPRAMSAPTPVSSFLHSAAMVKLGIFLIATLMPLFQPFLSWKLALLGLGSITMVWGIIAAFSSHAIKTILAYTTVSKLGFLVMVYGLSVGSEYAYFHILSHSFYKAALFMMAGVLIKWAGTKDIREMVLPRSLPIGIALILAALSFASFPGTMGFVSKEIVLKELLYLTPVHPGFNLILLAVLITGALSATIAFRFLKLGWQLLSNHSSEPKKAPIAPIILAALTLLFGLMPYLLKPIFNALYAQSLSPSDLYLLKPFHGFNLALLLSLSALAIGFILAQLQSKFNQLTWPNALQFEHKANSLLETIIHKGDAVFRGLQFHNPFAFVPITLAVFIGLMCWGLWDTRIADAFYFQCRTFSPNWARDGVILATMGLVLSLPFLRFLITKIIITSLIGLFVSVLFVIWKAPDLAITQLLVDIMSLLLLLMIIRGIRSTQKEKKAPSTRWNPIKALIAIVVGGILFVFQLILLENTVEAPFGLDINTLTLPYAEGANAVNTILVDFRGFDTFGEVSVLLISVIGIFSIFWKKEAS